MSCFPVRCIAPLFRTAASFLLYVRFCLCSPKFPSGAKQLPEVWGSLDPLSCVCVTSYLCSFGFVFYGCAELK